MAIRLRSPGIGQQVRRGATMQHGTIGRFAFATLLVALGKTPPAAAIDLGGDYVGIIPVPPTPFTVTDVQPGTTPQVMGHGVQAPTAYAPPTPGPAAPSSAPPPAAGQLPRAR